MKNAQRTQCEPVLFVTDGHVERWKWQAGIIPFRGLLQLALPGELADLSRLQAALPSP